MTTVLLTTVGGSHQPIISALREARPSFTVFFCTDRDLATGKPGSRVQIDGKGLCIRERPSDEKPTLPNIPTQEGLTEGCHGIVIVPADDLDITHGVMRRTVAELRRRYPAARLLADYTGGTKTMTAALVLAALEDDDIGLQLITGSRADLARVAHGTQSSVPAAIEGTRLRRAMRAHLMAWQRYAYGEAAAGLRGLAQPGDANLRAALSRARDISTAFAAWDNFDHVGAASILLNTYSAVAAAPMSDHMPALRLLSSEASSKRTGLQLWDLWLNAQRRAVAGRFDDAVGRTYRLIEWTAQWLLETQANLRTSDLPGAIAAEAGIAQGRDGRYQAGLHTAWMLVGAHVGGVPAAFINTHHGALLDHLQRRNHSILAHGFTPIGADEWRSFQNWLERAFIPMLRDTLQQAGVRSVFPQLPTLYPWDTDKTC